MATQLMYVNTDKETLHQTMRYDCPYQVPTPRAATTCSSWTVRRSLATPKRQPWTPCTSPCPESSILNIVSGQGRILGGAIQTYTVTAADANGNLGFASRMPSSPATSRPLHIVSVFMDGDTSVVRPLGLTSENEREHTDSAVATFRIRAKRGASA